MTLLNSLVSNSMAGFVALMLDANYKFGLMRAKYKARQIQNEKAQIVKWRHIYGVIDIPWTLEYDFLKHRSPSYLRTTKQSFKSYYQKLFGVDKSLKKVLTPSDDHFYRSIANTGNSFYMRPTGKPGIYYFDLSQLMSVEVFPGYYFEVRGLEMDDNSKEIVIITRHNKRIKKGDPNYEQAKIHGMACLNYFNVGIGHSWVHFQLPCVVSAIVFNEIPRDSVLYKIMSVHTRFTMRINHQALRIRRASENKNTKGKRYLKTLRKSLSNFHTMSTSRTTSPI